MATARLPVRISVGNGRPIEVGVWELTADESGRFQPDTAAFAEVLRAAANELAPRPAELSDERIAQVLQIEMRRGAAWLDEFVQRQTRVHGPGWLR